jgi:hypothetical protein
MARQRKTPHQTGNKPRPLDTLSVAYRRRIQRHEAAGRSRAQARGHARASEQPIKTKPITAPHPTGERPPIEVAVSAVRKGASLQAAAKQSGVSPERLRRHLHTVPGATKTTAKGSKGRWDLSKIPSDWRLHLAEPTAGGGMIALPGPDGTGMTWITIAGSKQNSLAGEFSSAVAIFRNSNDRTVFDPFIGKSLIDVNGKQWRLETRPDVLRRRMVQKNRDREYYRQISRMEIAA